MRVSERAAKATLIALFSIFVVAVIIIITLGLLTVASEQLKITIILLAISASIVLLMRGSNKIYLLLKKEKLYHICEKPAKKARVFYDLISDEISNYYKNIEELNLNQTIPCSYSVVNNAQNNTLKYIIKYSNIDYSINNLEMLDEMREYIDNHLRFITEMNKCAEIATNNIPLILRPFTNKKKIAYYILDLDYEASEIDYAEMTYRYVSPAGRAAHIASSVIDLQTIIQLQEEISSKISKRGHAKTQRSRMTKDLREAIKKRDNYTCQNCGNSVLEEPNLLLEVDHIIPVSKGGKTEASNLQTLCWKCNREKHDN